MNQHAPSSAHAPFTAPGYRPDIDGLRAIAVLAVVGFHAFPQWLTGGFIGVDIFFVISGYLITGIIANHLQAGNFSFRDFYARRVKRIFPALLLVLLFCMAVGWFFLLADEYRHLGKHVAGGAAFISNFLLLGESGYFDNNADTKPLLHLWSLGIEEQYYIFWPFLLWAAHKVRRRAILLCGILLLASFALNLFTIASDTATTFYSPLTRVWELMVGSWLAFATVQAHEAVPATPGILSRVRAYVQANPARTARLGNLAALLGALLFIVGFSMTNKHSLFPGWLALLPTIGAALIIAAGPQAWLNRHVLGNRVLVWFGIISFPLYLWHWPLLSFNKIIFAELDSPQTNAMLMLAAVVLAWLTYRLIERPVRFSKTIGHTSLVLSLLMVLMLAAGYLTFHLDGLTFRPLAQQTNLMDKYSYDEAKTEKEKWDLLHCAFPGLTETYHAYERAGCETKNFPGRPTVFLVGDSFSGHLGIALRDALMAQKLNLIQYSYSWCVVLSSKDTRGGCAGIATHIEEKIKELKPEYVIIFGNYIGWEADPEYHEAVPYPQFLAQKAHEFHDLGAGKVILLGQMPTYNYALPKVLLRHYLLKHQPIPDRTHAELAQTVWEWDTRQKAQTYGNGVEYFSLKDLFCNDAGCLTHNGPDLQNDLVVFDFGHLTKAGAQYVTDALLTRYIK